MYLKKGDYLWYVEDYEVFRKEIEDVEFRPVTMKMIKTDITFVGGRKISVDEVKDEMVDSEGDVWFTSVVSAEKFKREMIALEKEAAEERIKKLENLELLDFNENSDFNIDNLIRFQRRVDYNKRMVENVVEKFNDWFFNQPGWKVWTKKLIPDKDPHKLQEVKLFINNLKTIEIYFYFPEGMIITTGPVGINKLLELKN